MVNRHLSLQTVRCIQTLSLGRMDQGLGGLGLARVPAPRLGLYVQWPDICWGSLPIMANWED